MRTKFLALAACALICMGTCAAGAAQLSENDDGRRQRFEQFRERIEKLKAERLQKALALDEPKASQIAEISRRYDQKRFEVRQKTQGDMRMLRQSLQGKNNTEVQTALERVEQRKQALQALQSEERAEVRKILTPEQMAKYTLFQEAFASEMREKIREIRQRRGDPSLR